MPRALLPALVMLGLIAACTSPEPAPRTGSTILQGASPTQPWIVRGQASYRERMALPPGSIFEATLEDTARADGPAAVLGRTRIEGVSGSPIQFSIAYDPSQVTSSMRLGVRARVVSEGRLLFSTDTFQPVTLPAARTGEASVNVALKRSSGEPNDSATALENTYWRLARLGSKAVAAGERQREAHIILQSREQRVSGSTGCNRMMGGYTLKEGALQFGRMATTMMACMPGIQHERGFLDALQAVRAWRIEGQRLSLLDAQGQTLAELEALVP